ncbi:DUF2690 domain-containing protein [Spirillospora sp. NPDC049652]
MRRVGLGLAAVATAASGMLAVTPSAQAATCSGNGCNGTDPVSTGCSNNSTAPLQGNGLGGHLELRWGPTCSTNWARFTPGNGDVYEIWVTRRSDGAWAGYGMYVTYKFSGAGVPNYSDQIYSPGSASACVRDITTNSQNFCLNQP